VNAQFQVRAHKLGSEYGWELVGPDNEVWARGEPETKTRMCELLSVLSASIGVAGLATEWASGLCEPLPGIV
jgi:hypothetical protein